MKCTCRITDSVVVVFEVRIPDVNVECIPIPCRDTGSTTIEAISQDHYLRGAVGFVVTKIQANARDTLEYKIAHFAVRRESSRTHDSPAGSSFSVKCQTADLIVRRIPTKHRSTRRTVPCECCGIRIGTDDLSSEIILVGGARGSERSRDPVRTSRKIKNTPSVGVNVLESIESCLNSGRIVGDTITYRSEVLHVFPTGEWSGETLIERVRIASNC